MKKSSPDIRYTMHAALFLAKLRRLGWTQVDLAYDIDYRPETVNRWARGHRPPPVVVMKYLDLKIREKEIGG